MLLAPDVVVDDAEANRCACHQDAVVHVRGRRRRLRRPKTPEKHEDDVHARESVVDCAPDPRNTPGTPHKARLHHVVRVVIVINGSLLSGLLARKVWSMDLLLVVMNTIAGTVVDLPCGAAPKK